MFLETICINNSVINNIQPHLERMETTAHNFGFTAPNLPNLIEVLPNELRTKKVRCSITYHKQILDIKFIEYTPRVIKSLKLIESDIIYSHKFSNREQLNNLLLQKGDCDEVLIIKNNYITDTTFSNVVFKNKYGLFTPNTYLLNGTKRQTLIKQGIIIETEIAPSDIKNYEGLYLINAMLDIGDTDLISNY